MNTINGNGAQLPIGLFDSGVGGLTVLAALRKRLPQEHYCYLGDTARLPYGTKSSGTIVRYSLQATKKLVERRIKLLVVACNTATAAALPELRKAYAPLPVVGVIEPGAGAAYKTVKDKPDGGKIIVMATESTILGAAYTKAIQALKPDAEITGVPCSLFVSLAEEGWMNGPIAEAIAERYLAPALAGTRPDCIVLGCTHFPPLAQAIAAVVGEDVVLVDSAATTAEAVEQELKRLDLLRPDSIDTKGGHEERPFDRLHFLTTDAPERFARVGSLFLDMDIAPEQLELVTL
jgi:glutamate racemase